MRHATVGARTLGLFRDVLELDEDDHRVLNGLARGGLARGDDLDESDRSFQMAIDLMGAKQYPDRHMPASVSGDSA